MSTLAEHARKSTKERSVEREILDLLAYNGWLARKHDVIKNVAEYGSGAKKRKRFIDIGSAGDPDIWAARPQGAKWITDTKFWASDGFDFLLIECKRPKGGKLSPAQTAAHAVLRKQGYVVIIARSWADVVKQSREAGVEVERTRK